MSAADRLVAAPGGSNYLLLFAPRDTTALCGTICTEFDRRVQTERMDPESDELWKTEAQGDATEGWQRYGREAFTGVRLLRAAERSIALGAAIVFC